MSRYKKRFVFFELCQLHGKLNVPSVCMLRNFIQGSRLLVLKAKRGARNIRLCSHAQNAVQKTEVLLWRNRENRELETARFA